MLFNPRKRYCGKQIGDYTIIDFLGQGKYGVCFLAEVNGEKRILKRYKPKMLKRNRRLNCFEAQILSNLQHSGIPRLYEILNEKNFQGIVLEWKCGVTLETMLFKQRHRFSGVEFFNIGQQLIAIIQYLHQNGVVHRDIRIPNVLVNGMQVALVDFGLARWEDQSYTTDRDFSYLGDLLLYLLYSDFTSEQRKKIPWYDELKLSIFQKMFLKRLLRLEEPYPSIAQIAVDFQMAFAELGSGTLE